METTMQNYKYPEKNTCLTSGNTNITNFFLQVLCVLKIAQLKRAYTLSTNPSIGGEGRVCTIPKGWDLGWNPAFWSVQSNSMA